MRLDSGADFNILFSIILQFLQYIFIEFIIVIAKVLQNNYPPKLWVHLLRKYLTSIWTWRNDSSLIMRLDPGADFNIILFQHCAATCFEIYHSSSLGHADQLSI